MKTKILKLLVLALCISLALFAGACSKPSSNQEGSFGLVYALNNDGKSYTLVSMGSCTDKDIVIPNYYKDLPVTGIHSGVFQGDPHVPELIGSGISSIVLPNTIEFIYPNAFAYCYNLTSVYFNGSIEEWCNITFMHETSHPLCYGGDLYIGGELVTELVIPNTVTEIKDYAFLGCESLTSVEIPNSVESIGESAFCECEGLTSVEIGNSVKSIGDRAFENCYNLTSVVISDSVTTIGDYAFWGCESLTSVEVSEENEAYKSIDGNLYTKDGKTLVQYAVGKTDKEFVIPDSVTSIGERAFEDCSSITSLVLSNSVTSIGGGAFEHCYNLTSVYYKGDIEGWCNIAFSDNSSNPLDNVADLYIGDEIVTELVIPNTVTEIKEFAFGGCSSLTSVVIPDSVESIGFAAFEYCYNLTSVEIPNSVESIGASAFCDCESLTSIEIGNSVKTIGENAFSDTGYYYNSSNWEDGELYIDKYLIEIQINEREEYAVKEGTLCIAGGAISNCYNLTSVVIPDSVISISDYAFLGCRSLTSVEVSEENEAYKSIDGNLYTKDGKTLVQYAVGKTDTGFVIPNSVEYIGAGAFASCYNLTSVVIPDSVITIGDRAFESCVSLTSVETGNSVKSIGGGAFENCYNLTSVVISDSVTTIGDYAFFGCESLISVVIGDSVEHIGDYAFYDCHLLTSIVIPDSVEYIGLASFYGCYSLTSVVIGDSVEYIGAGAFYNFYNCVYFKGAESEWAEISIGFSNFGNKDVYYYIENGGDVPTDGGNYWHYDKDGKPVAW